MTEASERIEQPSRTRLLLATLVVVVTIAAVWKVIDYRTQPPPPPNPVGASPTPGR